jgi:hypothetical protein
MGTTGFAQRKKEDQCNCGCVPHTAHLILRPLMQFAGIRGWRFALVNSQIHYGPPKGAPAYF